MTAAGEHLVVTGGPSHDFAATTAQLVEIAGAASLRTTVLDSVDDMIESLAVEPRRWSVVTCNLLAWRMEQRPAEDRGRWAFDLSDRGGEVIGAYVAEGGALLAMHTAVICFDAHPRWRELLGATWDWQTSDHPPPGDVLVEATGPDAHELVEAGERFTVRDELYHGLDIDDSVTPLYRASIGETRAPAVWCREVGVGRVVVDVLGHDAGSLRAPPHRRLLERAYRWLLRGPTATIDREGQ